MTCRMNERLYLNAIQELFWLIFAIRLLICPALSFDVLWAHTLRTGLKKATSLHHPFIHGHPLSHTPIHPSLHGLQNTDSQRQSWRHNVHPPKGRISCESSPPRDSQMTVKREALIKISVFLIDQTMSFVTVSNSALQSPVVSYNTWLGLCHLSLTAYWTFSFFSLRPFPVNTLESYDVIKIPIDLHFVKQKDQLSGHRKPSAFWCLLWGSASRLRASNAYMHNADGMFFTD